MPIAAVPEYLQKLGPEFYLTAPPGHRFLLYFAAWGENQETSRIDWRMKDRVPKIDKKTKQQKVGKSGLEWEDLPNDQFACTIAACKTPAHLAETPRTRTPKVDPGLVPWQPLMKALLERQTTQAALFDARGEILRLDALATAPFTTGLGNEHPLENGFAFLNPYGLPYLPGSGVKGVLRQAARELASGDWGESFGWTEEAITALFGREGESGDTEHQRGALVFWDVIPQVAGDSLAVEIMTPHQSHYYQWKKDRDAKEIEVPPHESGQPNPITFLTVPHGSRFVFHVQCKLAFLAGLTPALAKNQHWKTLLEAAFQHAYQWLGFGAKTAVGYGAMEEHPDAKAERKRLIAATQAEAERRAEETRRSTLSPEGLAWEEHQPLIESFREKFETARKAPYNPGGQFNNDRNEFLKVALAWTDQRCRTAAGELLKATLSKAWGTPGNKDNKQRLLDAVAQLGGTIAP
ncbi:MAG: type III-B CRISPR module RAMP protein Cmr6 [Rhodocyclaceae bacterium]|nr:type III-B CRISPR module RAMP protein Cmr6 [Rhodocyclaceae bacterium]